MLAGVFSGEEVTPLLPQQVMRPPPSSSLVSSHLHHMTGLGVDDRGECGMAVNLVEVEVGVC